MESNPQPVYSQRGEERPAWRSSRSYNRARLPTDYQKVAEYGQCTVTDWKKYILISWRQSKRDVCTIFSDCGCCIGQENRRGRGPFPDKRRHDDNARIPNKKKEQNDNMPEEICLLLLKRRLSNATSGCHSKVNCRGKEQWQSVCALRWGRKVQKFPFCILSLSKCHAQEETWADKKFCRWAQLYVMVDTWCSLDFS